MATVLRLPAFLDDLTAAYAYLARRDGRAADRLLDAVEATIDMLGMFPELGRRRDALRPQVRSFRLRRFPYILFYRSDGEALTLMRLLHGAREQGEGLSKLSL